MRRFAGGLRQQLATLVILSLACSKVGAQPQATEGGRSLPAGQIIERVACGTDPAETYALYLPSRYSALKAWPIIYTFDPMARGKAPVALYKDIAEKYGPILAASNNSANFRPGESSKAAQAIWMDTHIRLQLDPRRIYTMGFSGGARVATSVAMTAMPARSPA